MAGATSPERLVQRYGTIIVVGGGCYGGYYVRQLRRAREAGAVEWTRLVVVDRDPACPVFTAGAGDITPAVAEWTDYFASYLGDAVQTPARCAADAVVPSPLMPHLMFQWLFERARQRWPGRPVERRAIGGEVDVPWQRSDDDRTHYVSFATWMCPINCIEPVRCPHTRTARDWSMPRTLARFVDGQRGTGRTVAGPAVLHVTHRAYGVGMFDTRDVLAADALVTRAGQDAQPVEVVVATASHCHGAVGVLALG